MAVRPDFPPGADLHTDEQGACYLDNLRSSSRDESDHRQDSLIRIDQAGRVSLAAAGLTRPNGIAGTADGRHLVVAETSARRLTRFRVADDGSLTDQQVFADVSPAHPDGICLDAEGNIWLGSPDTSEFLRVREDGTVLDRIGVPGEWAVACAPGGPDGRVMSCRRPGSFATSRWTTAPSSGSSWTGLAPVMPRTVACWSSSARPSNAPKRMIRSVS